MWTFFELMAMFFDRKMLLDDDVADIYAKNVNLSTGGRCRLRSISLTYPKSLLKPLIWKTLKHCKAVQTNELERVVVDTSNVTYEDVKAICHLPKIQYFTFCFFERDERIDHDDNGLLDELMETSVKKLTNFRWDRKLLGDHKLLRECTGPYKQYSLYRINF